MKTLETIQKITNAFKILSKVVMICSTVGAIGCAVGIIGIAFIPDAFKLGGVTIHSIVERAADESIGTGYASMAFGMIQCVGYAILGKLSFKYFDNEVNAGTPFTESGAKELNLLGLYTVCIPLVCNFASEIVLRVLKRTLEDVADVDINYYSSVFIGLLIMFIGLLCKYGAEQAVPKNTEAESNEVL